LTGLPQKTARFSPPFWVHRKIAKYGIDPPRPPHEGRVDANLQEFPTPVIIAGVQRKAIALNSAKIETFTSRREKKKSRFAIVEWLVLEQGRDR
jgi:hypothetical protein